MDPRRVRRVVRNLLGNAIEHGEGRPIVVTVDSDQGAVAVGVRDFGLGMTAADSERVFDRFWRADPSRKRTIGGTGLGLSIALGDARLHGGTLAVWSELGRGTNFVLTLPRHGHPVGGSSPIPVDPGDSAPLDDLGLTQPITVPTPPGGERVGETILGVALACLFGWSNYIAAAFGLGSDPGNNPVGPIVAALVVVACQGRAEFKSYWRRLRSWRASPGWYMLAVLVPLTVNLVIVLINHGFGAPLPTTAQLSHWPELPVIFLVNLVLVGIGEEAGWTAFAAPLLLRRHGLLGAWAILAALRILWHLPLMLTGNSGWVMGILGNAAFQMILLQLFYLSGGQWSLAAVWHATLNTFGGSFFTAMVSGADQARYGLLLTAFYTLLAILALIMGLRAGHKGFAVIDHQPQPPLRAVQPRHR